MAEYHVAAGVFGKIYAGILKPKKDDKPQEWKDKSDVTDEALVAVRDLMADTFFNSGHNTGGYSWTRKDGKVVELRITLKEAGKL